MSGLLLPMPPGDPAALEGYATSLAGSAKEISELAGNAAQVASGVKSKAKWTGSAASGYTASAASLAQSLHATVAHLETIAGAVRHYATALRTARKKVSAYNKAAQAASCLVPKKQHAVLAALAGQRDAAQAAVIAADTAGDIAAQDVAKSEGGLVAAGSPFAPPDPVGPNIQSGYLLQQVKLLDLLLAPPPPNPNEPSLEALPPGALELEKKRAELLYWLAGGDLPGSLPDNPHVPEEGDDPGDNSLYQSGVGIPYLPDIGGE